MHGNTSKQLRAVKALKEYWFIIAVLFSGLSALLYYAGFGVTPWDTFVETKFKRNQARYHADVAFEMLERGDYVHSKAEFEKASSLAPSNRLSNTGRYLVELFVDMESPDWDASTGFWVSKKFAEHANVTTSLLDYSHILEKYFGDSSQAVGLYSEAKTHYEAALAKKGDYLDALYAYHGLVYAFSEQLDYKRDQGVRRLVELAETMVKIDGFDFRGYHALVYSLYEQTLFETDINTKEQLLNRANEMAEKATQFKPEFAVLEDLAEITRSSDPGRSLQIDRLAKKLLDVPNDQQSRIARMGVQIRLLNSSQLVTLSNATEKRALANYYLALDYLALHRTGDEKQNLRLHRKSLAAARKLDVEETVFTVYQDRLKSLDSLLPASKK